MRADAVCNKDVAASLLAKLTAVDTVMLWRTALEATTRASNEELVQNHLLQRAACAEAAFRVFEKDSASNETDGSAAKAAEASQDWMQKSVEGVLRPGMEALRTRVSSLLVGKVNVALSTCTAVEWGKWKNNINGTGLEAMKIAARPICEIDFATRLKTNLNTLVKEIRGHQRNAAVHPTHTTSGHDWCFQEEASELRNAAQLLGFDEPTVFGESMQCCAEMSAIAAEANIITTLASSKLVTAEKRARLDLCFKKFSQQSQAYKVEVKPLVHAPLLEEATQWLLEN
eukprot:6469123-Amphidinium_carterae.1